MRRGRYGLRSACYELLGSEALSWEVGKRENEKAGMGDWNAEKSKVYIIKSANSTSTINSKIAKSGNLQPVSGNQLQRATDNTQLTGPEVHMKLIAPSILSADFSKLGDEIRAVEAAGADWIHADIMDGHFVPNITMGPMIVEAVRRVTSLPIDVHLMIENPDDYIPAFAKAGATLISVQIESSVHLNRSVQLIRECGVQPGVVVNPSTPVQGLEWILEYVDYVLIMGVNPGFGGQKFITNSLKKIEVLRNMIHQMNLKTLIEIDGGVNEKTIADIAVAGVDVFVAGSAIFGSSDYQQTINSFRNKIGE